ncbi:MAG: cysteine synthase family protein [Clostridia bacterium]|nr:cysteine synthase family protein [Clostridia bacterium]
MNTIFLQSMIKTVGNTPLLQLRHISRIFGCAGEIFGKAEFMSPTGSIKDRTALYMVKGALERGILGRDSTVIAATGGNSAVSLAMICANMQLACVIVMPDDAPKSKISAVRLYGGRVMLIPAVYGTAGTKQAAEKLRAKIANSVIFDFFDSEDNCDSHRDGTAKEILSALDSIDVLVAGVGTGGTITGCGEVIKRHFPECRVVAVEPSESPVLSGGEPSSHGITGIGAGVVPPLLNTYLLDEVLRVRTGDALEMCRLLARHEGMLCGISSGAALAAAVNVAKRAEMRGKNIVCILPDRGDGYVDRLDV